MFRGRFEHNMDEKGRLSIPSKFRELLATHYDNRLIVTNFDGCLWAYPYSEWQQVEERVAALPQFREEVKALQRVFISAATECAVDRAGRIMVPQVLRDYAGISHEVVIVGMIRRIEIWSMQRWQKVFDQAQTDLNEMGSRLADLGL